MTSFEDMISRIAFLFLIFAVISSAYVTNIGISCQMQHFLSTSLIGSHVIGLLMTFVFVSLEGGMSFNSDIDAEHDTNWSRANMVSTFVMAIIIYSALILSSKMQLVPNIIFFVGMMLLYVVNTHRRFLRDRQQLDPETDAKLDTFMKIILVILLCTTAYGVTDYIQYQQRNHPDDFSWSRFMLGKRACDSVPL